MNYRPKRLAAIFLGAAGLLAASLLFTYYVGLHAMQARGVMAAQRRVVEDVTEVLSTLKDAEAGRGGYLLTGKEAYLEPYRDAAGRLKAEVGRLRELARTGDVNGQDVAALEGLIDKRLALLDQTIGLRHTNYDVAVAVIQTDTGKRLMDQIGAMVEKMRQTEEREYAAAEKHSNRMVTVRTWVFLFTGLINLGFLAWAYRRIALGTLEREKQHDLLSTTLASIGDAVILTDAAGRVTFLNPEAERLTGWTSEAAKGQALPAVFKIVNEDTRQPVENPVEKVLRLGTVVGLANHTVLIARDGRETPIDDSAAPIRRGQGPLNGVVLVFRDFSEHKRSEATLRQNEQRLSLALQAAQSGVWENDLVTGENVWGQGMAELLGVTADCASAEARRWMEYIHSEDRALIEAGFREAIANQGQSWSAEFRVVRTDGQTRWLASRGMVISQGEGRLRMIGVVTDITERKRTEAALRADLRALTRMHELSVRRLGGSDLRPLLQEIMEAAVSIMGADKGSLQLFEQDSLRIVAHHNQSAEFLEHFSAAETLASACGEAARNGRRVVIADVETSPLFAGTKSLEVLRAAGLKAVQSTPILSRTGELLGMLSTHWRRPHTPDGDDLLRIDLLVRQAADLIEQARVEEALRDSERLFRETFEHAAIGIAHVGLDGRWLRLNSGYCQLLGYTPEELLQLTFGDITHPEDLEQDWAYARRLLAGEIPSYSMEKRYIRKDGSLVWVKLTGVLVRDAAGQPDYFLAAAADISERKQMEQTLRESEERFRTLADGTPVLVWVHGADGELRFVNRAWREFFGTTLEEAIGGRWKPLLHPEDQPAYVETFLTCHAERRPFAAQARVRRHDGEWRWVESTGVPRFSVTGEFLGMAGSSVDITERKQAEAVLARDKEELEQLVADRTAKLQDLVNELEHFSYTITHDMRAPLRAMRGLAEIMTETDGELSEEERRKFTHRIIIAAERMDGLITDALHYSRLVQQEQPIGPVDLEKLLRGMLETYPEFQSAIADIRLETLPRVMGNEAGFTQCFSNLLGNALKFSLPGEAAQVRIWSEPVDDKWVKIWVEDKGIGIAPGMLPRVFDMFARGSSPQAGNGIGLALVRKVVDRMGGQVGVESEPGKGSRFWVQLRAAESRVESR